MLPRLLTIWENIRSSLWALPLAMMALAAVAAVSATGISIEIGGDPVWSLYSGEARDAPLFLSNLVTATITLATLAISITMVVLTLAAQQLGPRLIRIFMSDLRQADAVARAHHGTRAPAGDDEGRLRLIMANSHFDGLLDASFNMIRQYGDGSAAVLIRLAERLGDLYALADEKQREHIRRHLDMILRAGRRSLQEPNDIAALEQRIPDATRN